MNLNFTYDLSAYRILHDPEVRSQFSKMKSVGVETIYVFGYFYGKYESAPEEIATARIVLENEGFNTGVINIPCGHGGNALNPDDPTIDLTIGKGWHMRYNSIGNPCPTTTCIDEVMINDSRKANEELYQMGYRRLFNDDDLRLGFWGSNMQGCFCDRCMAEFSSRIGRTIERAEITSGQDKELIEAWLSYQCEKIPHFLLQTTPLGMQNGIMIMHNGDRRHGIDIPLLRKTMPDNLIFRVGEGHFCDSSFMVPEGRASIVNSIRHHMALVGNPNLCYSESTVYPMAALSPENWIRKMEIEIECGLRNLYLMSGTYFFTNPYWDMLEKELPKLRELAESTPIPSLDTPDFIWQI